MFKWLGQIIRENTANLALTAGIARMDLRRQHNASDFGVFWAFAKPVVYLLMFYFAIMIGFRHSANIEGSHCPYFIWLAAGIVQWQFVSDLLVWGAGCFQRHANIIRNTEFPLTTIPMIAVLSRFYVYLVMVVALIVAAICMGVTPSVYWFQLPIYIILTVMFCYIWVMLTALMNMISPISSNSYASFGPRSSGSRASSTTSTVARACSSPSTRSAFWLKASAIASRITSGYGRKGGSSCTSLS